MFENMEILNDLIVGRVEPYIYAFSTNTIPNYLKIGDTYRPVSIRLNEWKKYFPTLKEEYREKAIINNNIFFRDYSVHQYLENNLKKIRLLPNDIKDIYYSNEFFKDTNVNEIQNAIIDIKKNFTNKTGKYQYYNSKNKLPEKFTYSSKGMWKPRPNQQKTIDNFKIAIDNGRKNLLMYAVMRFGKSFTSLCCAKEISAKLILVVSAKADVREEWKKTVEQAENFNKDYIFISNEDISQNGNIIRSTLNEGKGIVIFLTLQDLQGENIKNKHREIFENIIDLLIIDETHYGARAEKYGKILKDNNYIKDIKQKYSNEDFIDFNDANEGLKALKTNVKLHLSGTPYRILMGSEFKKEDIIAFYQFTDIVDKQVEWDSKYILNDDIKEWENPYFGFPQMIRFAFNPSNLAQAKLMALKKNGYTYAFSALFKPKSITKSPDNSHKEFTYQGEVLDLLNVIDGNKDDEQLLGFLNYDKIKEGNMCRHIVCVLPYCASCDALEKLLVDNKENFVNLQNYTIINISGVDKPSEYKNINAIKSKIKKCEDEDKKTITLTVNRMLTGSTVEQWDTMLFFKDTASPQEYDQAIFRLQNQYIKTFISESGELIKFNMKPQTLLVDFDPHRMFFMQEQKSLIYNANTEDSGNQKLQERMSKELKISPIIAINKNKIVQVEPCDILNAISNYSNDKGIIDETIDIPVDFSLLDIPIIKETINSQAEIGSKNGLQLEGHTNNNDGTDLDIPDSDKSLDTTNSKELDTNRSSTPESELQQLENKFRMFYSRILFYSFLSNNKLKSLDDILNSLDNLDNIRIAKNLQLDKEILKIIRNNINLFILSQLDYKIQNINALAYDESLNPEERAIRAINKFGKLSESEVPTPLTIATDMVELLQNETFNNLLNDNTMILDIASKIGEFAIAICKKIKSLDIDFNSIKSSILTIPTSTIAYEFTRKIYAVLGLDLNCIASTFTSYDLLDVKMLNDNKKSKIDYKKIAKILKQNKKLNEINLDDEVEEGKEMKFEAIVGNPPYQVTDGGAGTSAAALYDKFVCISKNLNCDKISMLIPSRWFAGGKGLNNFRENMLSDKHIQKLIDFENYKDVFPQLGGLAGGVCYFLWNKNHYGDCDIINYNVIGNNSMTRSLSEYDILIRQNKAISIIRKIQKIFNGQYLSERVSSRKPFSLPTNYKPKNEGIPCWFIQKIGLKYANEIDIDDSNNYLNKWKLLAPKSPIAGQTDFSQPVAFYYDSNIILAKPGECCTESFIILGAFDTEEELLSYKSYIFTKTVRFLLMQAVISQDITKKCYRFVPDLGSYTSLYTDDKLCKLWNLTDEEFEYIDSRIK
ncbi:MAG: Eco57I restriction-modification methylase domain-containing protein [Cetobacterium sp.]